MSDILWLTGLSASGKTTLALKIQELFQEEGKPVAMLDGDIVRDFFEGDLGYSRRERILNVKRIGFTAHMLAQNDINVIVANIAPYYEVRDFLRKKLKNYIQIYLKTDFENSLKRSPKGFFEKYQKGELTNFIGLDDTYDIPRNPDLTLDTINNSVDYCLEKVKKFLNSREVIKCQK